MENLEGRRVIVTGGSRGFGLGIVEALVARKAHVTVIAKDAGRLAEVAARLGVETRRGDVADEGFSRDAVREVRPNVLVMNAGATPTLGRLDELTWEQFDATWSNDVKASFLWVKEALRLPLEPGTRVILGSSGAAVAGSPLSGGYAGAKRMIWLMAHYANGVSAERKLDIRFQTILPMQISGETELGRAAAAAYARKRGMTVEEFLAGFGKPMPLRQVGEHVATILTEPKYESGVAFALKGDTGITLLDS